MFVGGGGGWDTKLNSLEYKRLRFILLFPFLVIAFHLLTKFLHTNPLFASFSDLHPLCPPLLYPPPPAVSSSHFHLTSTFCSVYLSVFRCSRREASKRRKRPPVVCSFPDNTKFKWKTRWSCLASRSRRLLSWRRLRDKSFELITGLKMPRPVWLSDAAAAEVFAAIQSPMNDKYKNEFRAWKVSSCITSCFFFPFDKQSAPSKRVAAFFLPLASSYWC